MMADEFSQAAFVGAIGASFTATWDGAGDGGVELALDRVEAREAAPGHEAYAVYFRGPGDRALSQQTVRLDSPGMATMTVFMVPVAQVGDRIEYEACFHHLASSPPVGVDRRRESS
jgi:hypothetical protein